MGSFRWFEWGAKHARFAAAPKACAKHFSGHEESRWRRNLRANPRACLTLEDAENVVILEGAVEHFVPEEAFAIALGDAANEKYEFGGNAAELYRGGACRFRPRTGHAWRPPTGAAGAARRPT